MKPWFNWPPDFDDPIPDEDEETLGEPVNQTKED